MPDYNFGTLVRGDATREYAEDNSILVTRVQFYAIEVGRLEAAVARSQRFAALPTDNPASVHLAHKATKNKA